MIHTFEQIRRIAIPSVRSCGVKNLYLLGFRARGVTLKTATSTCLSIDRPVRSAFRIGGLYADLSEGFEKPLSECRR